MIGKSVTVPGLLCLAALLPQAMANPQASGMTLNPVEITEWEVPYQGRARDPFVVAADEVWFVGQSTHYLARLTPSTGAFFRRPLPDEAGPHNLIVGADGMVWYAGNLEGYIGRYDPDEDSILRVPMPDPAVRDPHTLVFDHDQSHIWFTAQHSNVVGRLRLEDRQVSIIDVATPRARPYGIRLGPDGVPWIVLLGSNRLASVNPGTLALTEYEIPAPAARPRRLEITPDGRIWYSDYARGYLGSFDPDSGRFSEWVLPSGALSKPYGTALDKHGRVWVVETGVAPNLFVGFDTNTQVVVSVTPIPSAAGSVRHMDYHAGTDTVWFGTDARTIGRAQVGQVTGR